MAISELDQPLADQGIAAINFFDGRLLTAKDLTREQQARRAADSLLGRAVGAGVIGGLEVTEDSTSTALSPVVAVAAGLAINRAGQALNLEARTTVRLVRPSSAAGSGGETGFANCAPLLGGTYVAGPGVYLLSIACARAGRGRAAVSGIDPVASARCNTDVVTETVQFRLLRLDHERFGLSFPAPQARPESLFRNRLAALCLGMEEVAADPFSNSADDPVYSVFATSLTDRDVPLALLYWTTGGGIRFMDQWAVRRQAARKGPVSPLGALVSSLAARSALGEARLNQFASHLADLLAPALRPGEHRIEDYFRHVPPVALVPVTGPGSVRGVGPSRFLAAFSGARRGRLTTGSLTEILLRSFHCPALDLQAQPCLQVYEIDENKASVGAGNSSQRYQVLVDRRLNGPASRDGLSGTLLNAWEVYRGLIRRRVFLPVGVTPEEIAAQIAIVGAVRDVMDIANREAARAHDWALDDVEALSAMTSLYELQNDLISLLESPLAGAGESQGRETFAREIRTLLDVSLPEGAASFRAALEASDLCDAVAAQDAINHFVGQWSGEGVAVGPTVIQYIESPSGTNLVPGSTKPFPHRFRIINATDRRLVFSLEAGTTAPSGEWEGSTSIHRPEARDAIDSLALPAGGQGTVEVRIAAPGSAEVGETAALTLVARVAPPNERRLVATLDLPVADDAGEPVTRTVSFVGSPLTPSGGTAVIASPGVLLMYGFNVLYTAEDGPETVTFSCSLSLTVPESSQAALWMVGIGVEEPLEPVNPDVSPAVFRRTVTLDSGVTTQVRVFILVPTTSGRTASFTVQLDSEELEPALSAQRPESFTIRSS